MNNPFTDHPHAIGQSYLEHFLFAVNVGSYLFLSAFAFALHGAFPFIKIPRRYNLEAVANFLLAKNHELSLQGLDRIQTVSNLFGMTIQVKNQSSFNSGL